MKVMILLAAGILAAGLPVQAATPHESPEHALEEGRVAAMRETTLAFLASLDDAGRAAVLARLDDNARRTAWSNLPVNAAPRSGLTVAKMNAGQRQALHATLAAAFLQSGLSENRYLDVARRCAGRAYGQGAGSLARRRSV